MASAGDSSHRTIFLVSFAGFGGIGESSGGSYLADDDTGRMELSLVLVLGDDCDGVCGAGGVTGGCDCGMEIFGALLPFLG